jgi:hypothetical protein
MTLTLALAAIAALLALAAVAIMAGGTAWGRGLVYGGALLICAISGAAALFQLVGGAATPAMTLPLGLPWLGAHFRMDALSASFLVVVNLGAVAASLFALGHGRHEHAPMRAATCSSRSALLPTAPSCAATCATHPGSNGRCSRPSSKATSSPTSRSATNRSTAPIQATTFRNTAACVDFSSKMWCAGA